jgi:Glycosyltransferase
LSAYRIGGRLKNIDVVSAQDPFECGFAAWLIARRLKAKLQFQIHTDFLSPCFVQESFVNKMRVCVAKFLLPRADGIRVVSERIKNSIIVNCKLKIDNSEIVVLPIFVDVEQISKNKETHNIHSRYPSASHIILMASRFTREKNILMGLRAMQEVVKRYPKALLLLVGDGPENKTYNLPLITYNSKRM